MSRYQSLNTHSPSKLVKTTWLERMMRKPARGEIPLPKDINYTNLGNEFRELGDVDEYELVPGNNELRSASKEWEKERKEFAALEQLGPSFRESVVKEIEKKRNLEGKPVDQKFQKKKNSFLQNP